MAYTPEDEPAAALIVRRIAARTSRSEQEAREAYQGEYTRLQCASKVKAFLSVLASRNATELLMHGPASEEQSD
jgi:hypothetical protein